MARIRTVKPSFFTSLTITALPLSARLTFIGLWTYADDEGRGVDDPRLVKAEVWPLDDDMTARKIDRDLARLADDGLIIRYQVDGRRFLQITNWGEHQRVNRPTPSKHPVPTIDSTVSAPASITEPAAQPHGAITEPSPPEGKGWEGKGTGTPQPPASGGQSHDGQHSNCRACGTTRRGPKPQPPERPLLPPNHAPEAIADLDHHPVPRIPDDAKATARQGLAEVHAALRRPRPTRESA